MNIRGIQKTSLIDFPHIISTVLFIGGCNLRCRYCHNPLLACNDCTLEDYPINEVLDLIKRRKNFIGGIVLSGGEPTLAKGLIPFLEQVKDLGLKVKIDTNGFQPDVISLLLQLKLLDYVAIDIKTSPEKYPILTKTNLPFERILTTITLLQNSSIPFELRTTCIPRYVTIKDLASIKQHIGYVEYYFLQQFCNSTTLDPTLQTLQPYPKEILYEFRDFVKTFAKHCEIRGI